MKARASGVIVYQAVSGAIALKGDGGDMESIWATQAQIAEIFTVSQSVTSRHIANILRSGEINQESNMQKMHITGNFKPTALYSLDVILAVGYRTNSSRAIACRKWATKTLRQHITKGYTINHKRIGRNYAAFMSAMESVRALTPSVAAFGTDHVLTLIRAFAQTWFSLDAYDRGDFAAERLTKRSLVFAADELLSGVAELKAALTAKGEAAELFAQERSAGSVAGIVGSVFQTFGGKPLYPGTERQAANLLYFMVKDHPFVDGNKRSGAFAFAWFLQKAGVLDTARLTPEALTALTVLVAESHPKEKERMIGLIALLLAKV